jgi:hypothetical protein
MDVNRSRTFLGKSRWGQSVGRRKLAVGGINGSGDFQPDVAVVIGLGRARAVFNQALERARIALEARLVCDYLAGMTDGYAARTYKRLFSPDFGSINDL